jgi:carbamoyltransferase
LRNGKFKNIWIQPAAGDAGGSLGAALGLWHIELKKNRTINSKDSMSGSYLGPDYSQSEVEKKLKEIGANFEVLGDEQLIEKTALELSNGKTVGWFQGRMEFGPRALGCRSILADARSITMQKNLNLKVKYRESFRPFAPSVIREDVSEWFEINCDSPYMLLVSDVVNKKRRMMTEEEKVLFGIDKLNVRRSDIPAVTHVDYSARIQTVHKETNPKYYKLISEFKKITGCPVLVNTSFNVRGEPIVNTPENAFNCFEGTEIDTLVIENCILYKANQDKSLKKDYKIKYELD